MSSNGETSIVLEGVTHGAVDFLIKPVRIEELRNLWQHVVRRRKEQVRGGSRQPCRGGWRQLQHSTAAAAGPVAAHRAALWGAGAGRQRGGVQRSAGAGLSTSLQPLQPRAPCCTSWSYASEALVLVLAA